MVFRIIVCITCCLNGAFLVGMEKHKESVLHVRFDLKREIDPRLMAVAEVAWEKWSQIAARSFAEVATQTDLECTDKEMQASALCHDDSMQTEHLGVEECTQYEAPCLVETKKEELINKAFRYSCAACGLAFRIREELQIHSCQSSAPKRVKRSTVSK